MQGYRVIRSIIMDGIIFLQFYSGMCGRAAYYFGDWGYVIHVGVMGLGGVLIIWHTGYRLFSKDLGSFGFWVCRGGPMWLVSLGVEFSIYIVFRVIWDDVRVVGSNGWYGVIWGEVHVVFCNCVLLGLILFIWFHYVNPQSWCRGVGVNIFWCEFYFISSVRLNFHGGFQPLKSFLRGYCVEYCGNNLLPWTLNERSWFIHVLRPGTVVGGCRRGF